MSEKMVKSDDEWRQRLTPEHYRVMRQRGTEAPLSTVANRRLLSRRAFLKKTGFGTLGCALILTPWNFTAWHILRGGGTRIETTKERNKMELARNVTAPEVTIPPIDAAAPTATETATFAMG